jgi:hypothetical protein
MIILADRLTDYLMKEQNHFIGVGMRDIKEVKRWRVTRKPEFVEVGSIDSKQTGEYRRLWNQYNIPCTELIFNGNQRMYMKNGKKYKNWEDKWVDQKLDWAFVRLDHSDDETGLLTSGFTEYEGYNPNCDMFRNTTSSKFFGSFNNERTQFTLKMIESVDKKMVTNDPLSHGSVYRFTFIYTYGVELVT